VFIGKMVNVLLRKKIGLNKCSGMIGLNKFYLKSLVRQCIAVGVIK